MTYQDHGCISVLMSVYNEPVDWMRQAIESILNQTYKDFEFIIVNEVDGRSLADSQTEIVFAHNTEDGWIPGITDKQLLAILCERFKRNPKKVEILRALMNS